MRTAASRRLDILKMQFFMEDTPALDANRGGRYSFDDVTTRPGLGVETRRALGRGHRGSGRRRLAGPVLGYRQRLAGNREDSSRISV
jgi:hypothetical protein